MNKTLLSAAFAAVALSAAPAAAQVAPAGPRVEGLVGYDRVRFLGEHEGGLFAGVGAGYDMPVASAWSLGADVEASYANTDADLLGFELKAGRDLYAGLRATYAISDRTNWYFKGGYTTARFKVSGLGGDNVEGFRLGTGFQYLVGSNAYVGGEYRYSKYDDNLQRHQLAAFVGTRFGAAPAPVAAPVVEAPAPAPAPATQTCADGSVILATDVCPAPAPAPMPAPAPAGERG